MGIYKDIFEEFFGKLIEDKKIPTSTVNKLKEIWKSDEIASQEKILEAIKKGLENVSKD